MIVGPGFEGAVIEVEFPDGPTMVEAEYVDGKPSPVAIDGWEFEAVLGGWFAYKVAREEYPDDGRDFSGKYEP